MGIVFHGDPTERVRFNVNALTLTYYSEEYYVDPIYLKSVGFSDLESIITSNEKRQYTTW